MRRKTLRAAPLAAALALVAVAALAAAAATASAEAIVWRTYAEGMEEAAVRGKPVLIDFYADWCTWCDKMDEEVYTDAEVERLASAFACVKVDGDSEGWLVDQYGVEGYPTVVFADANGTEIGRVVGFRDAEDFAGDLRQALGAWNGTVDDPLFSEGEIACSLPYLAGMAAAPLFVTAAVVASRRLRGRDEAR